LSGHSKWSSIKHKKAATDAKKGKAFSRVSKEISVAARLGGGDPDMNPRLRVAIDNAKGINMPAENVKRAIQKGTGELPGVTYEEITYEGYAPGGVALIMEVMTDNRVRTIAELRNLMGKKNGNMAESGSVAWIFETKGYILIDKKECDEETLMNTALDAGAEDIKNEEDNYEVLTVPEDFSAVKEHLEKENIKFNFAEITRIPKNYVKLEAGDARKVLNLVEALEDHDDIQNVYSNFDIPDEFMQG
jgi:YebC/PmpR family DNA-binding regulatory protein